MYRISYHSCDLYEKVINIEGPITWSTFNTPGLNSALLTGLNFFCDYMDDFNPGLKCYTFLEVKKAAP
jgi:hypothetical protein